MLFKGEYVWSRISIVFRSTRTIPGGFAPSDWTATGLSPAAVGARTEKLPPPWLPPLELRAECVGRLREDPLELERVLDSGIWVLEPGMALGGVGSGEVGGIGDGAVDVGCER